MTIDQIAAASGVVITGAATGLGRACALRLDELGVRVFAGVLPDEDCKTLKASASEQLTVIELDVTRASSIAAAVEKVEAATGTAGLKGLVNNAGIAIAGPVEFLPVDHFREQFEVNFFGQIAVTQAFLPMLRVGHGRIVMMGSSNADLPIPFSGAYSASKSALRALTTVLRAELRQSGIRVTLIVPGAMATPIWSKSRRRQDELVGQLSLEDRARYGLKIADRSQDLENARGLPPELVAAAVADAILGRRPRTRYVVGLGARLAELIRFAPLPDEIVQRLVLRAVRGRA